MRLSIVGPIVVLAVVSAACAQDVSSEPTSAGLKTASKSGPVAHQKGPEMVNPMGQTKDAWWSDQTCGWIGAIGGPICGLLGGLVGSLSGCGKARRFVLTICAVSAGLGVVSLVIGAIALALGQPYAVYYPLLLCGILEPVVMGPMFFLLRWAYQQRELHKMAAMDAGLVNSRTSGRG